MTLLGSLLQDPLHRRWPTLVTVMLSRLVLLAVLLVGLAVILPHSERAFYFFIALAFLVTIPYALWLRSESTANVSAPYQFAVDVFIITGLVHFTGGIRSELMVLYPLVILVAGIVVSGRQAILVALLGVLLYAALVLMEMEGILVYRGPLPDPNVDHSAVVRDLMLRTVIFTFFTAAASFIADRCFFQERQLRRLQTVGQLIFDNVTIPLIGVHADGQIVLVNSSAGRLLRGDGRSFVDRNVLSLFVRPPAALDDLRQSRSVWEVRASDNSTRLCLVEVELAHIPALVDDSLSPGAAETGLYLVALQDLTDLLQGQTLERDRRSLSTAAGVVTEMAHIVQNPLTAIRGAGELLAQTAGAVAKQRRPMTTGDWTVINSICDVIAEESARLDDKVKYYLDCAAQDPGKLMDLVREARIWNQRLPILGNDTHGPDPDRR